MEYEGDERRGRKQWGRLFRYSVMHPALTISTFLLTGLIFWGGVNWGMDMTNSEDFCISCHEMEQNVYQEYKKTIHYSNRTGVRATCPDCHVPKEWTYMVKRKIEATNELFHKIMGSVDTPEKFEAKRLVLANYVWETMKKNDSHECRNCHSFKSMELIKQQKTSKDAHQRAVKEKRTCIDCHMGIAHKIAKNYDSNGEIHKMFKKEKRNCGDCHKGMQQGEGW
ncbi:Cytochrome c-type protein NapC [hydrothermal vent metagenome]|uniref:Cytochrome c-type protein NapC n=1 Tax=hydrothermal vent metagenome TaxID=652676 RepID=A0A3B0ZD76_9ZZZZ